MSGSETCETTMFDNTDPDMQRAYENARATFRYFWREAIWEQQRIIPALDLLCVKAPFSDDPNPREKDASNAEHMWLSEVDFDGQFVTGVLLNTPNRLKSINEGDSAQIPLSEISDWMYTSDDDVFGAFTVNVLRSRMGRKEREEHDRAWGLNFGDPAQVRVQTRREHSLSIEMGSSFEKQLAKDPSLLISKDRNGWTLLHRHASAGSVTLVKVLLKAGADPNARANNGMTPLSLAKSLGWNEIELLLTKK